MGPASPAVSQSQASRIASAVWQARAVLRWLLLGAGPLAHLPLSPRRAPLALGPHVLGAPGRLAPLVGLPALAAPGAIGRPREEPRDVEAACGLRRLRHLLGDAGEREPDMSRAASPVAAPSRLRASGPVAHAGRGALCFVSIRTAQKSH